MSKKQNKAATPRKKRAVGYGLIMAGVVFVLVVLALLMRMLTMQDDYDRKNRKLEESYSEQFASAQSEYTALERRLYASELLNLAQNAYNHKDMRKFQGYMASLEGYTDALSAESLEIYEELEKALRG